MNSLKSSSGLILGGLLLSSLSINASATLTTFASYSGNIGVSVNAGGSTSSSLPSGLTASIPAGSIVLAAYLYTSTANISLGAAGSIVNQSLAGGTFNGSTVNYTALPANPSSNESLQAGRANVTSIVQAAVNPLGSAALGGVYNFTATETDTANQDGEVLVAIYSNSSLPIASIGVLDGATSSAGDTSMINFNANPSGSKVLLSLGDGYSYDLGNTTNQFSTIQVDGKLLTAAAGNCDYSQDGGTPPNATNCNNGDLITAGKLGLNADGSVNTAYSSAFTPIGDTNLGTDHELYDISSLIDPTFGNSITLTTKNTSLDDNIFLETFYVGGLAGFNMPPPPPPNTVTPEPATLTLLTLALGSSGLLGKFRRRGRN